MEPPHAIFDGRLRARRDLVVTPGDLGAVVKDPLSLEYFRLGDRERFVLETLRTPTTVDELTRAFARRYPHEGATASQVLAFCASLFEGGLVVAERRDFGPRRDRRPRTAAPWWGGVLNPLAIRLPGIDPTPLLRRLDPLGRLLFSRGFAATLSVAAVVVAVLCVGRAEEALREGERLAQLFDPRHAGLVAVAVAATKCWHELGHALACRRAGAECHEAGVLLLALLPCLYCDASDAWALPTRWRRVRVALAGVYFEAILAVLAAAAWLALAPGPARTLAFYVVGVATVSTLLVNLNPLLRFDGYYVLSDAWGVANLHQQSRAALWRPVRRWVRGEPRGADPELDASPALLAAFGLASTLYGVAVLTVVLWVTHRGLAGLGLRAAGDVLLALAVAGLALGVVRSALAMFAGRSGPGRVLATVRGVAVGAAAAGVAALALSTPLEQSLHARCRVESDVYADVVTRSAGVLAPHARYGDLVSRGDLVAELRDDDATLRELELRERAETLASDLAGLRTRASRDVTLLAEIARLESTLAEAQRQLATHLRLTASRRLHAPLSGRVVRPAERRENAEAETPEGDLATWGGAPLEGANRGCWLEPGETLCRIVGPGLGVVVLLDEVESGLVETGDRVRVALDRDPGGVLDGRVESISPAAATEDVAEVERLVEGSLRGPLERGARYRVRVTLTEALPATVQAGAVGQARILTGRETLGGRLWRAATRLLRLG